MSRNILRILAAALFAFAVAFGGPPARTLTGSMSNIKAGQEINSAKGAASGVTITLVLSADGSSVAKVTISVKEIKFEIKTPGYLSSGTGSGTNFYINGPFPIKNNAFKTPEASGANSATGRFISPTEAQGTAHLYDMTEKVGYQYFPIDLGEWQWKATAK